MKRAREISRAVWRHVWTFCLLVGVVIGTGTMMAVKNPSGLDVAWGITGPVIMLWWAIARIAADMIELQHKVALKRLRSVGSGQIRDSVSWNRGGLTPDQAERFVTDGTWSPTNLNSITDPREGGNPG